MLDLANEIKFTNVYKKYKDAHPVTREIECLKAEFPAFLQKIEEGDLLAGRIKWGVVGFSPEPGGLGYYVNKEALLETSGKEAKALLEFWESENTSYKVRAAYPEEMAKIIPSDDWSDESGVAFPLYRMAGTYLNYDKLVKVGIPGLLEELAEKKRVFKEQGVSESVILLEGMEAAVNLLIDCCMFYARQALELAESADENGNETRKAQLLELARVLDRITKNRPETMFEAMQLAWLYTLLAGSRNYGRMDVYLGDYLVSDLERGRLTEEKAQDLVNSLWVLIAARDTVFNGRVVIGGLGRRNEKNADRFCMLALEATRQVREIEPQLTLRFYQGMNPEIMEKAMETIGQGTTYPMLYNDDVNVDAVAKAFDVSTTEAKQYVPLGCGEYVLDHMSFGSPNGVINLLKALEITLHNGRDLLTGKQIGLKTGEIREFKTFEDLFNAYKKQVEHFVRCLADQEELEYKVTGEIAPFLYLSMLYDDCIERGKGIFSGGIKYLGGTIETYGNINTSDSLTAIKELVFEWGLYSLEELTSALVRDFNGYEQLRNLMLACPKYGNDHPEADKMAVEVHDHICNTARDQRLRTGLHSYLVVIINNHANTLMGRWTGASADGRRVGEPMANGNNPSGGSDKNGITAFMNSLVKLDPTIHAGAVQNMKFGPEMFKNNLAKTQALLETYFKKGGTQAMISVVDQRDLIKAMDKPKMYQHVFVRVGGFSARFVDLLEDVQREVISRTVYR